jgi:hypothetical protein
MCPPDPARLSVTRNASPEDETEAEGGGIKVAEATCCDAGEVGWHTLNTEIQEQRLPIRFDRRVTQGNRRMQLNIRTAMFVNREHVEQMM